MVSARADGVNLREYLVSDSALTNGTGNPLLIKKWDLMLSLIILDP